jgi:hypothetical protein
MYAVVNGRRIRLGRSEPPKGEPPRPDGQGRPRGDGEVRVPVGKPFSAEALDGARVIVYLTEGGAITGIYQGEHGLGGRTFIQMSEAATSPPVADQVDAAVVLVPVEAIRLVATEPLARSAD